MRSAGDAGVVGACAESAAVGGALVEAERRAPPEQDVRKLARIHRIALTFFTLSLLKNPTGQPMKPIVNQEEESQYKGG